MGRWGSFLTAVAAALLLAPSAAGAATIRVTSPSDSGGGCTLRGAIESANANAELGGCHAGSAVETDVIEFALLNGTTIHVEGTALEEIEGKTEVRGPGAGKLTVDGGGDFRVFALAAGAEAGISGLKITGGGGAECALGCGISNPAGASVALEGLLIEGNEAVPELLAPGPGVAGGGGIFNGGSMTLTLSTVKGNKVDVETGEEIAGPSGGGIQNSGSLRIDRSTVADNEAIGKLVGAQRAIAAGGGIANANGGALTVERSAISGNSVEAALGSVEDLAEGGGIANSVGAGAVVIRASTIADNSVTAADASPFARGGGIFVDGTSFTIGSSTISGNSGVEGANLDLGIPATVESTIVAGPVDGPNCVGTVTSLGFNLESANDCGFDAASDQVETNPGLGTLGANGGPTETIPLLSTSPAIDKGNGPVGETLDQRGLARPVDIAGKANAVGGNGSDVGADEVQVPIAQITSGPLEGTTLSSANAAFAFKANEAVAEFRCTLDGASLGACASPKMLTGLADGSHTFGVVAVAQTTGFTSSNPTTRTFTVSTHPAPPEPEPEPKPEPQPQQQQQQQSQLQPQAQQQASGQPSLQPAKSPPPATTITGLKPKTTSRKLTIRFSSSQAGSTFACSLDHGPFKRCTSPYRTKTLGFGSHSFQVVATNSAGVADPTPAAKSFRVLEPGS
ncbi:MAG TPA: choice-of-anchor Q domain-containing protein [Solirubrobacterales bacterium]|jgi:hypothetical protein